MTMLETPYDLCVSTVRIKFPRGPGGGVLEGVDCVGGGVVWVVCWQASVLYHLCFQWVFAGVLRGLPFQLPFFTPVCQKLSISLMLPA